MATKLFFRDTTTDFQTGNNDTNLRGSAVGWATGRGLSTTAGSSTTNQTVTTVAGTTPGVELPNTPFCWYSLPLNADVTISGSITWNIWAREANAGANAAINGRIEKVDGATGVITLIDQTARVTEIAASASVNSVNNFAETPAAGIACKRGDRLRVRLFIDDAGTMGTGFLVTIGYDGPTAAADGDSFLTLTENLTFVAEPAGTQVFPTEVASAVSTASTDLEAWTSRGGGVTTATTNTVTGYAAPVQVTDTAGGTVVDWFTRPLTAFTLGGAVRANIRTSLGAGNGAVRAEIARVAADGTSVTVWGVATHASTTGGQTAKSFLVGGADLAVSAGQRLRIRFYIDDAPNAAMVSGSTFVVHYAGTTPAASGDTYLTFTQALTEFVSAPTYVPRSGFVNHQNPGVL